MKYKTLLICVLILLVFIVPTYSYPSEQYNWDWRQFYGDDEFVPWWGNNAGMSFNEPSALNWYPVADWEKKVCATTFSTDFYYDNQGITQLEYDDKVYDITISLNVELQNTSYTDENGNSQYSLTVGWYIQGIPQGNADDNKVEYKILLKPGNDYIDLGEGDTKKEFTIMTGTSGFYSNYTINEYDTAELIIDSNSYEFIIDKLKENGEKI